MSSGRLGELCSIKGELNKYDGRACLLGVSAKVSDLLVVTKLVCVSDCFTEESLAIEALHDGLAGHAVDSLRQ